MHEHENPNQAKLNKLFSLEPSSKIDKIVVEVRKLLGISLEEQKNWKSIDDALKEWREVIESRGVFIFKDAFKNSDFSGFCLYDSLFPVIYMNNSVEKSRQIFTLFHELAHLIFKTSGIDKIMEDDMDYISDDAKKIEIACNEFAGEFLVPRKDFIFSLSLLSNKKIDEETISSLANNYCVSREVILRKLLDVNKISQATFRKFSNKWAEEFKNRDKKSAGGNFYYTRAAYLGQNYIKFVLAKMYQNNISQEQAADYLNLKINQISGLEAKLVK